MILYAAGAVFSIWMAVDAVRRGHTVPWLWIILFFGPIGATAYLLVESPLSDRIRGRARGPRTGKRDLRRAAADAERLDNAALWTEYATMLREARRFGQAAEAARRALAKDPEARDARFELGMSLLANGSPAQALEPLREIVDAELTFASGDAAFALCEALVATADPGSALPYLERLAETSSRPRFLYGLASVQAQMGQREAAVETLQRILDESIHVPAYAERETRRWVRRARKAQRKLAA